VVSLGYTEQDTILAFGVVPVGVRYAFGPRDDVFFSWADTAAGGATPRILPREEVDPEAVAALRPDLIMAVTAGLDQNQYEVLSRIAPVVVAPKTFRDFGVPWQDQTRITGRALGQSSRAEELVAQVEAKFAEVKAANPGLIGKSLALSGPSYDGGYPIHASADTRTRFFGELGMVVPPELDAVAGDQFSGYLSREHAGMLNEDATTADGSRPAPNVDDPSTSGRWPAAQCRVGDFLEVVAADAAGSLDGDAERHRHDVAGEPSRIGVPREVTLVDGPLEAFLEAYACVVPPLDQRIACGQAEVAGHQ
jgi:hypothetical protein